MAEPQNPNYPASYEDDSSLLAEMWERNVATVKYGISVDALQITLEEDLTGLGDPCILIFEGGEIWWVDDGQLSFPAGDTLVTLSDNSQRGFHNSAVQPHNAGEEVYLTMICTQQTMYKKAVEALQKNGFLLGTEAEKDSYESGAVAGEGWLCTDSKKIYYCFVAGTFVWTNKVSHLDLTGTADDDHVDYHCLSDDTQILTRGGWKYRKGLRTGEEIYTFNPNTGGIESDNVQEIFEYTSYDRMYHIQNRNIDLLLTEDHGMLYKHRRKSKNYVKESSEWLSATTKRVSTFHRANIPMAAEVFVEDRKDAYYELYGWFIGDGGFVNSTICFWQNAGPKAERIKELLDKLGLRYSTGVMHKAGRKFVDHRNGEEYKTNADYLYIYVQGDSYQKNDFIFRKDFKDLLEDKNLCFKSLLRGLVEADGHRQTLSSCVYYSKKIDILDDLQILCIKNGFRASLRPHMELYRLNIVERNKLIIQNKHFELVPYEGIAWCVKTRNRTLIVRRNGFSAIVHNTDARADTWHIALPKSHIASGSDHDHYTANEGAATVRIRGGIDASKPGSPSFPGDLYFSIDTAEGGTFFASSDGLVWIKISGAPVDAVTMFPGACPSGWTRVTDLDDKYPLVVSSSPGGIGGANTHSHTYSEYAQHYHTVGAVVATNMSDPGTHTHQVPVRSGSGSRGELAIHSLKTGTINTTTEGDHTHNATVPATNTGTAGAANPNTSTDDHRGPWAEVVWCSKD